MRRIAVAALCAAAVGGCATAAPQLPYPDAGYLSRAAREDRFEAEEPQSLFSSDLEVLSDSAIRRILGYRLTLEQANKVAVMQLGGRWGYLWWVDAVTRMNEFVTGRFVELMLASTRVREAAVLPGLMVPRDRAVPYLREAAARFQADLLFIFRPDCQTFRRSRFLAADEVRAACTVEAVLLDIRTGIVPFSYVATKEFVARKTGDDANFQETIVRAELQAITDGLEDIANRVVPFLNGVPVTER